MKLRLPERHGIDLPQHVRKTPKLLAVRDKLAARFLKEDPNRTHPDAKARAEARAQARIEDLLETRLAEHTGNRGLRAGSALDRVGQAQSDVIGGLLGVLGDKGGKALAPSELAKLLKNLRDELRGVRETMKDHTQKSPSPHSEAELKRLLDEVRATKKTLKGKVQATPEATAARLKAGKFTPVGGGRWRKRYRGGFVEMWVNESGHLEVHSARNGQGTARFQEFDVMEKPYREKPLSSRVMQAHHGCQDALMKILFGKAYDGSEAPTIWLRDSTGESPHGRITHEFQNAQADARKARLKQLETYEQIRIWAREDLLHVGASERSIAKYLQAMDTHVRKIVEANPKLKVYIGNVPGF
ncbi:MAG TPA: hypothetical protein VGK73_33195 [Polyangiaceae bacterium]